MQIRHLNSPKAGLVEHIDNATARTLIAAGFAEHVPYKDFRERLAAESTSQTAALSLVSAFLAPSGALTLLLSVQTARNHFQAWCRDHLLHAPVKDTPLPSSGSSMKLLALL